MECPKAEMLVYEKDEGRLLAQMVCIPRKLYIDGKAQMVGYATGLHKADGALVNVMKLLLAAGERSVAKQFFCSVLGDNSAVFTMFARRGLFSTLAEYTTYLIYPKAIKPLKHSFTFRRATAADEGALVTFYREEGQGYSFFPVFSSMNEFAGLTVSDFFVLEDGSGILAAGALWDQRSFKQSIMLSYGGIYKLAAHCNPLLKALQYPPLPRLGMAAEFAHLSFVLAREDDHQFTRILLGELASVGGGSNLELLCHSSAPAYSCLSIGAVKGSKLDVCLQGIKSYRFDSKLCAINHERAAGIAEAIPATCTSPLRFECGLL
jgi:hypothetical protein